MPYVSTSRSRAVGLGRFSAHLVLRKARRTARPRNRKEPPWPSSCRRSPTPRTPSRRTSAARPSTSTTASTTRPTSTNLNKLIEGTADAGKSLEEIVTGRRRAACSTTPRRSGTTPSTGTRMKPGGGGEPTGEVARRDQRGLRLLRRLQGAVHRSRDDAVRLRLGLARRTTAASSKIVKTANADTPLTHGQKRAPHLRRVGARVLHRLPQRAPEVRRDLPGHLVNWDHVAACM